LVAFELFRIVSGVSPTMMKNPASLLVRRRSRAAGLMNRAVFCSIAAAGCLAAAGAHAASFRGLGDLPGGSYSSGANGVSPDGCYVVGVATSAGGNEAFRWDTLHGMIGLGDLPGGTKNSGAWAVSAGGRVVVGTSGVTSGLEAFRWTASDGMVGLGDLPGGSHASVAHAVSADGNVIVGYSATAAGQEAFRWTASTGMTGLGDLAGGESYSAAAGISADGSTIVGLGTGDAGTFAVRWTAGSQPVALGDLPGGDVFNGANAVSADGAMVVGVDYSELTGEAFVWTPQDGMSGLGYLDVSKKFPGSQAFDISGDSVVVGYATSAITGPEAMLWDPQHGMRRVADVLADEGVDLAGWQVTEATGVSDDGRAIVGRGVTPLGQSEAWLARLDAALAPPVLAGDANRDGVVTHDDLAILTQNYGRACGPAFGPGDLTGDGAVSLADLLVVRQEYSRSVQGMAVAEPSTMALAAIALIALATFNARKRRAMLQRALSTPPAID
jgi:probable HAF family extracellular repeat protein